MKRPNIYARAARLLEREPDVYYPCFAICIEKNITLSGSQWRTDVDCRRFLASFTGCHDPMEASAIFLEALPEREKHSHDHYIVALCFAAAMLDGGDLK